MDDRAPSSTRKPISEAAIHDDPARSSPEAPAGHLSIHVWSEGGVRIVHALDEVSAALSDPDARLWVDVEDATTEILGELGSVLGLHDLVAEDIIERRQRAKLVAWDDGLHLVLFALAHDGELIASEVDLVLGRRFLLTSHTSGWRPVEVLSLERRGIGSLLAQGMDMLLYAVVDPIVDGYFPVIETISDEIDELEDAVVRRPDAGIVERLFRVRRALLEVRHLVSPEREILNQLANRDLPFVDPAHRVYFRDVYDHTIRVTEELDTHREVAAAVLDAYLTSVNNDLSDVMKRLTAITAVVAGVGAAAGIFGMTWKRSGVI